MIKDLETRVPTKNIIKIIIGIATLTNEVGGHIEKWWQIKIIG